MEDVSAHSQRPPAAALQAVPDCNEETLLAQVATGDHAAFATLYDRIGGSVYGLVRQIVEEPAADRVTEDVLMAVWASAAAFDASAGSARAWIVGMAHRHAVDEIRRGVVTPRVGMAAADSPLGGASNPGPAQPMVGGIEQVLRCLSPSQRAALELAYFHGQTYWQVARTLNMSGSSATDSLRDGLRRLAAQSGAPC